MNKGLTYLLIGLAVILIVLLGVSAVMLMQQDLRSAEPATLTPTAVVVADLPTATPTDEPPRQLPAPPIEILPTNTPSPTPIPTETPVPTETPIPTDTPTNTPVPVVIIPTNPPPPTNTPVPPTPVPPDTRGVVFGSFSIEGGPNFGAGEQIWFNFTVGNSNGAPIPFGVLGVYPSKDCSLRPQFIQPSWSNDSLGTSGLTWRDNIRLNESGSYALQLAVCLDAPRDTCMGGGGNWIFLSPQIPITVN